MAGGRASPARPVSVYNLPTRPTDDDLPDLQYIVQMSVLGVSLCPEMLGQFGLKFNTKNVYAISRQNGTECYTQYVGCFFG